MAISSTSLLLLCLFFFSPRIVHGRIEASSQKTYKHLHRYDQSVGDQPYRTAYHFQPPKNWMNDPNGPMIYQGLYHFFYQYNPNGVEWSTDIVWAHSTSTDLVNWIQHEPALYPSEEYDINGCWSGSATILPWGGEPAMLYTGINSDNQQVQNIAFPKNLSDPYLVEWVKSPLNPVMAPTASNMISERSLTDPDLIEMVTSQLGSLVAPEASTNAIDPSWFRDPTTGWLGPDGWWRAIIGSQRDKRGMAILYRSKDFIHWELAEQPLHSAPGTGMWECPDFFPVSTVASTGLDTSVNGPHVKHVLKLSLYDTLKDYYTIGKYDFSKDAYVPDTGSVEGVTGLRYDYGKFYASKTFFDSAKNRRVLWAWINESSTADDDVKKGWAGIQAVPRTIWLHKSGKQLVQWPITELEELRTGRVVISGKLLEGGSKLEVSGIRPSQADVEIWFKVTNFEKAEMFNPSWRNPQDLCSEKVAMDGGRIGPFGIKVLASKGLEEYTAIFFRIFKGDGQYVVLMCSDQSRSSLNNSTDKANYGVFLDVDPTKEKLSLRTLIDHSIVESFGGDGKGCITARVYPTMAIGNRAHLYAFNHGAEDVMISRLTGWSMKKARIN